MGYAELIHKIESLPNTQRNAVLQLVDALLAEHRHGDDQLGAGSCPRKMSIDENDAEVKGMRDEWSERG